MPGYSHDGASFPYNGAVPSGCHKLSFICPTFEESRELKRSQHQINRKFSKHETVFNSCESYPRQNCGLRTQCVSII